jgi:ParB-like chromosome segregation protein Spo0J
MRQIEQIAVDSVMVGERLRPIDTENVERVKSSLQSIGLQNPIVCRVVNEFTDADGEIWENAIFLVSGLHRLEAARALGWAKIDAIVTDANDIDAELAEIAENLHRADLSKAARDEHIRRYAELLKERERIVPQNAGQLPKNVGRPKSVAAKIAEETGLSDDTVRRALNPQPRPLVPKVVEPRLVIGDDDATQTQLNALVAAWNRAGREAREQFRDFIDTPVFDKSRAANA